MDLNKMAHDLTEHLMEDCELTREQETKVVLAALVKVRDEYTQLSTVSEAAANVLIKENKRLKRERDALASKHEMLRIGLQSIAGMKNSTLLGPDSKHHMGDDVPRYHEMGANAAFSQVAALASGFLRKSLDVQQPETS